MAEEVGILDSWGSFFKYGIDKFIDVEKAKVAAQPLPVAAPNEQYLKNEDGRTVRTGTVRTGTVQVGRVDIRMEWIAAGAAVVIVLLLLVRR